MDRIDLPREKFCSTKCSIELITSQSSFIIKWAVAKFWMMMSLGVLGVSLLDGKLKKERHAILSGANDGFGQSFDKIGEINPCHYWLVRPNEAIAPE